MLQGERNFGNRGLQCFSVGELKAFGVERIKREGGEREISRENKSMRKETEGNQGAGESEGGREEGARLMPRRAG